MEFIILLFIISFYIWSFSELFLRSKEVKKAWIDIHLRYFVVKEQKGGKKSEEAVASKESVVCMQK